MLFIFVKKKLFFEGQWRR